MLTPLKVGVLAAIGVTIIGASLATISSGGSSLNSETIWTLQKEENDDSFGNGSVAKVFGSFLIGVYGENDQNKSWWKDSYEKYLSSLHPQSELSEKFKIGKVNGPFSKKEDVHASYYTSKSLNLVCKSIYELEKNTVTLLEGDETDENSELIRDFWKYCSPLESFPQTIKVSNVSYEEGTIGKAKEDILLSTQEDNTLAWSLKERSFFNISEESIDSLMFKNFRKDRSQGGSLRDLCESTYTKTSESDSDKDATKVSVYDVVKYCSLEDLSH